MFPLKRRSNGDVNIQASSNQDDFGWWLNTDVWKSPASYGSKDCQSLASSESMFSCVDSDDNESYSLAQESKPETDDSCEGIEFRPLIHEGLHVDLIEQDAINKELDVTPFPAKEATEYLNEPELKPRRSQGMCYTPERLIRSQEYRILTPSPHYLSISQARIINENENSRKALRCRRRLNYLIDSKQVGATQLKALLHPLPAEETLPTINSHRWKSCKRVCGGDDSAKSDDSIAKTEDQKKSTSLQTLDLIGKRPSYERLNVTWEDCKKMETPSSSLEDTSGIQSNDWSSDSHSDLQNTPLCLCDELASTNYKLEGSQERCTAINEVVSILEVLDTEPEKATVLLDEDRFCDSTSSHDHLTRLALTIESDATVPDILEDPENLVQRLQSKVEKLENSNKDIFKDILNLRKSFQCDEDTVADISSNMNHLRQDIHELRYLDDLLDLLRGELKRISKRNWPFVIGHTKHHSEEMNLIV
ncbi:uncharacterized protein LOC143185743 [Calliopsis andreniformis]|uniref:uncharacterized protein LOC143185743 n=1 Tax=Calliopsis andreniformis TaxID=337506 RepID=UPI003FCDD792